MLASVCVGALDLFRQSVGPLRGDALAGSLLAAELAAPLLDLMTETALTLAAVESNVEPWERLGELDRLEVHQATGFLIAQRGLPPTAALGRLRAHAIATNQTASEVARAIMDHGLVLDHDDIGRREGAGETP